MYHNLLEAHSFCVIISFLAVFIRGLSVFREYCIDDFQSRTRRNYAYMLDDAESESIVSYAIVPTIYRCSQSTRWCVVPHCLQLYILTQLYSNLPQSPAVRCYPILRSRKCDFARMRSLLYTVLNVYYHGRILQNHAVISEMIVSRYLSLQNINEYTP